jgi:predicted RNase H-like HicB family nuclease
MSSSPRPTDEFTARVHQEPDGTYWAEVLELPGCFASGFTMDELLEALREAIAMYLDESDPGTGGHGFGGIAVGEMKFSSMTFSETPTTEKLVID